MAELVHLHLEHTLPELEEMERVGLFSREEIRNIVKKRKMFEYKLRRNFKSKEDFVKYIEYETVLLKLISKRRERLLCESKKQEIDYKLAKRINRLHKAAVSRFPNDEDLLLKQISFCMKMKWHDNVSALHAQMLKTHSKNPSLWVLAAKWELKNNRSPENARKLFQRSVLINPKSKLLWIEYFRMELYYIDLIKKRKEVLKIQKMEDPNAVENDVVLSGKIPCVVFDKALEEIDDDVDFALSFTQICLEFDFTGRIVDYILEQVTEKYPMKEETLDILAKQSLASINDRIKIAKEQGISKKRVLEEVNEEIFSKYEDAVKTKSTEKMWSMYIDFALNLINHSKENKKRILQDKLVNIMERAASCNSLSISYYTEWIDLLFERGNENDALSISLEAARKWQKVDLWFKSLTYHIQCMQPSKQIYMLLQEAIDSVPEKDSVILWKLGIDWLSIFDPEKLIEFFENGIKKCREVSASIKEMYLEVTALRSGVLASRELYKRFKKMGPISHQIVKKIIAIENGQLKPSIIFLRRYFEDGIDEFGSTNIDIWLDFMKLELEHEDGNSAATSSLIWRAKKKLQAEYISDFDNRLTEFATSSHSFQST